MTKESVWVDEARVRYGIPGVVIAIVPRSGPVRFITSGYCDIERARRCSPSNPFAVGSITKSLTGLLAAHLAAKGTLDLNRTVHTIDPSISLPDERTQSVTLRDLLDQTSGLGSVDWPYYWNPEIPRKVYLARLPAVPTLRPFRSAKFIPITPMTWWFSVSNVLSLNAVPMRQRAMWSAG